MSLSWHSNNEMLTKPYKGPYRASHSEQYNATHHFLPENEGCIEEMSSNTVNKETEDPGKRALKKSMTYHFLVEK